MSSLTAIAKDLSLIEIVYQIPVCVSVDGELKPVVYQLLGMKVGGRGWRNERKVVLKPMSI
jgi:hypothetical protein